MQMNGKKSNALGKRSTWIFLAAVLFALIIALAAGLRYFDKL
jgi:hypothetical protein